MNLTYKLTLALLIGAMFATLFILMQKPWQVVGSVEVGNSYLATTTPTLADMTNLCIQSNYNLASSTTGTLGAINVHVAGGGSITVYDATTTNVNLRSSDQATSSLILVDIPGGSTANSYHYDIGFKRGLLVDYTTTGTGVSSSTISYRCGS